MTGWLKQLGHVTVEHVELKYLLGQAVLPNVPPMGLLHTTEGSTVEGALSVFNVHYGPNFTIGRDAKHRVRALQHAPLGTMGQALQNAAGGVETNRRVYCQVEIVGNCDQASPWLPDPEVELVLANLMVQMKNLAGIPIRHAKVLRDAVKWMRDAGWVGHVDAPENEHVDPGMLNYGALCDLALRLDQVPQRLAPIVGEKKNELPFTRTAKVKKAARKHPPVTPGCTGLPRAHGSHGAPLK